MKKTLLLAFVVALLAPWTMKAQSLNDYTFSTGVDSTKWIPVPSTLPSLIVPGAGDYGVSTVQNIGFAFPFNDQAYSQFSVNADGNLRLGGTVTGTDSYTTPFSTTNANKHNPKINPMGCDGFLSDSGYVRKYNTVDSEGDSLLVVEFATSTYNTNSRASLLRWQVHLYPNGNITIVFASTPPPILPNTTRQCGMCVNASDIWLINATHVATHYTAGQSSTIASGTWPGVNRYYTFTAPVFSCLPPSMTLSNLTATSVDYSITPGGTESEWIYRMGTGAWQSLTSASGSFDNLTPNTDYTITYAALCGSTDTSFTVTVPFRTPCNTIANDSLPWQYGFEDATANSSTATFNTCLGRHVVGTSTNYPYPSATHHDAGAHSLYMYCSATAYSWLTLPFFEEDFDQLQLSFWAYRGTSANNGHWAVGVMTDPDDISTFDTISSGQVSANSVWEYIEVPLNSYTGTGTYLTILCPRGSAAGYTWVDDIAVDYLPTCFRPSAVTLDTATLTTTSASLTIVHADATTFMALWRMANTTDWDTVDVSGNTLTLSGLTPGGHYEGHVYTLCGTDTTIGYATFNITAGCAPITVDDLPYSEDFETYGDGASYPINGCWTKGTNSTTAYPYPYSTNAVTGTRSLYFYGYYPSSASSAKTYSWAALPPVDESLDMNTLMMTFKVKRGTTATNYYSTRLYVGVADSVSGLTDTAALRTQVTWIDTLDYTSAPASSVHDAEVSFADYMGTGKYVVFYAPVPALQGSNTYGYNNVYLDDVVLREIPSCYWPSAVVLDSVTTDEAMIKWVPDSRTANPASWVVEYGLHGFTPGEGSQVTATDTVITLTGLTPATEYDVYVSANCGGMVSESRMITIQTNSIPAELPYFTGFEAEQDSGWMFINAEQANRWMVGNHGDTAISGTRALFISDNGTSPSYTITSTSNVFAYRLIEVADTGDYALSFDWRCQGENNYDYLRAFIVPNSVEIVPGNLNGISYTATPTGWLNVGMYNGAVQMNLSSGWQTNEFVYHVAAGQTGLYKLVFFWHNDASGGTPPPATVDNVHLYKITCPAPTHVVADSVGAYQIDLAWTAHGTETSWELKIDSGAWIPVATNSYSATGLTPVIDYTFRVRAICGEGDTSMVTEPLTVRSSRDCGTNSINVIDTIGNGTSSSYTYTFYGYSTYYQGYNSAIYTVEELSEMGLQENNRINGIVLHSGSTGGTIRQARIYVAESPLAAYSSTPANDTLARSSMTLVYSGDLVVPANSWVEIPFTTPFVYSGNNNLRITFYRDTNSTASVTFYYTTYSNKYLNCYGYRSSSTTTNLSATRSTYRPNIVFDICTEIPSCARPTDVTLLGYSDTSMTLTWHGYAAGYEVAVSTTPVEPDSVATGLTTYTFTNDTVTVTGLTENTTYYYYVRSLCGNEQSAWRPGGSMRTACSAQSLPFFEGFESYSSGTTAAISPCWVKGTSSTTAYPYPTTTAVTGSRSLYFYGYKPSSATTTAIYSYAALPKFEDSVRNLMMNFSVKTYSSSTNYYYTYLLVGVMSNPNDISTFVAVDTVNLHGAAASSVHGIEVDFSSYTGNGEYIAIYDPVPPLIGGVTYAYSYAYVDDIMVERIPTCRRPNDVTVNNITSTTATVHWTHTASNFEVEYGSHGFAHGTGTTVSASGDSTVITGLSVGTYYDVYVRALCAANDNSEWSFAQSFYTACGIFSVPYTEDFESYGSGSAQSINPCWVKGTNSTTAYPYPTTTAANGVRSLYFYSYHPSTSSSTSYYSYAALPEFNAPLNTLELNFNMRRYSTTTDYYTSLIVVGVMTNRNDITTFEGLDTIDLKTAAASSIHEITVTFDNYTDTGKYIAFLAPVPPLYGTGTYSYNYVYLDDVYVTYKSPCERAFDLTAEDATHNSVVLEWTDTIGSTSWMVAYAVDNDTIWTEVLANSNPFTLTGLTPSTTYKYKVAPICSDGQQADWSRSFFRFNTSQVPATLPYSYNFETATEWDNWQTLSNNQYNWYRGNAVADSGYSMYLSADGGATHSWNTSLTTNAVAFRDINFGATPAAYQLDFDALVGGATDAFYDGLVVFLIDPVEIYAASSDGITTPWGSINDIEWIGYARHDSVWTHHTMYIEGVTGVKRLVFYHFNNAGADHPRINIPSAVDNIAITAQACERPFDLTAVNVDPTQATITWNGDPTATYEIAYRVQGTTVDNNAYQIVTTNSAVITGLSQTTAYYLWVRKICTMTATDTVASGWCDGIGFSTPQIPATVPYVTSFEDDDDNSWVFLNSDGTTTATNKWVIGDAVHSGGSRSLYISKNNGTSNLYDSSSAYTVLVYRTFHLAAGSYDVSFDWRAQGESTWDFLRAWVIPANEMPSASSGLLTGYGFPTSSSDFCSYTPASWFDISGVGGKLNLSTSWQTAVDSFDIVTPGYYNVVFLWRNDGSLGTNPPAAIDSVTLTANSLAPVCDAPAIETVTPSYDQIAVQFTGTATAYEVAIVEGSWNSAMVTPVPTSTLSHVFTGLEASTRYTVGVRAVCDTNFVSEWMTQEVVTDDYPCFAPTNLSYSNVSISNVTLSWTIGDSETEWEVNLTSTVNSFDTIIVVNTNPVTLNGLTPSTPYSARVRARCTATQTSDWTAFVNFTTSACQPVTNVTVSGMTANSAIVSWSGSSNGNYQVEYGVAGFTQGNGTRVDVNGNNTYTITGLLPEAAYDVFVRVFCGEGVYSDWSEKKTFTTLPADGIDDVNGSAIALYPNPATVSVTLSGLEGETTVTIVDLNGREVKKVVTDNEQTTISLDGMAQGAYFVRITGEQTTAIRKLIIR